MKKLRLDSQARKAFPGRSRGLTMIEVLIAIAILGIISITFLGALSTASLSVSVADERTVAESLARRQIEDVKNQIYSSAPAGGVATYSKISNIPAGYSVWSVNRNGTVVADIVGIPWDSKNNEPPVDNKDIGLQKISLVIKHKDKENPNQDDVIYTFINKNLNWAYNVTITLEGYKVDR